MWKSQTKIAPEEQDFKVSEDISLGNTSPEFYDADLVYAKALQYQFDKVYNDGINRIEAQRNGASKIGVSYKNYRNVPDHCVYDTEYEDDKEQYLKNWDQFDFDEKELARLPECGFKIIDWKIDTKKPKEKQTHIKVYSDATTQSSLDRPTKFVLFKFINKGLIASINGIISTGKESIVLHANGNTSYPHIKVPEECAIKVFKTMLGTTKARDLNLQSDQRYSQRLLKRSPRKIVDMWAEKEMQNLLKLEKIGINCPKVLGLQNHTLVTSFIGRDNQAAPKLKDLNFKREKWQQLYEEVLKAVCKMFVEGYLIHGDLSEHNILWFEGKCWFIDFCQSVQPDHPSAVEFLFKDYTKIIKFFGHKGVITKSAEKLVEDIYYGEQRNWKTYS